MKICHIITRMIVGGAQENTLFTIIGHIAKGHEVVLITGPSPGPEGELLKKAEYPDFRIIELPSLIRNINPVKDFKAYCEIKEILERENFDVVHTHDSKAGIIGRCAAWNAKRRVPVVVHTVHGQAFHRYEKEWKNFIYKFLERFAAKHCHQIYAVAQAMIDQCVAAKIAPAKKYRVIYSGMDIEKFLNAVPEDNLREQLGIPAGAKVIGSVARLFPLKGYEDFIPCALQLARRYNDLHFLIVGDGIMRNEINQRITQAGLAERFHFSGLVAPDQVYRYIALMNVLWHLSVREGLPRSVVQALAGGKPAIGYQLDGTPEVILNDETGYCVPERDLGAVMENTIKILDSPELAAQMGKRGRELTRDKFDWHKMSDILEAEYLRLYKLNTGKK